MSARLLPTKAEFDASAPALEAYTRLWVERECISFDAAVLGDQVKENEDDGSIWDMPTIDSKRTVSLLEEMEQIIGGDRKLPVSAIKSGGYTSADDLIAKLFPRIRDKCPDVHKPGLASTIPSVAPMPLSTDPVPSRMLP